VHGLIAAGISIAIIVAVASLVSSLNATFTSVQTAIKQKCPRIFRAANAFARADGWCVAIPPRARCRLWVKSGAVDQCRPLVQFRNAPKADALSQSIGICLGANSMIASRSRSGAVAPVFVVRLPKISRLGD
jgi:hypothetical protein